MPYPTRALFVDSDLTFVNGTGVAETPPGSLSNPAAFLDRIKVSATRNHLTEISVVVGARATKDLGFPKSLPMKEAARKNHKLLQAWRADGWNVSELNPWMTLWSPGRPSVHIGSHPWMSETIDTLDADVADAGLFSLDEGELTYRLAAFQRLTGVAYHGSPGLPGIALLRDHYAGKGTRPDWKPRWDGCTPARALCERAIAGWHGTAKALRYKHTYDGVRQYLAAARNTWCVPGPLRHTRCRSFDRKAQGYWLITSPVWNVDGIPNPTGYQTGAKCWVTTPTMELLEELGNYGFIEFPAVEDSWTSSEHVKELLRPWADRIDAAYHASLGDESKDGPGVTLAVKGMYKQGLGLLFRETSRVWRPDWHHSVIAKARCNLWRKIFKVWRAYQITPTAIDHDAVTYQTDTPEFRPAVNGKDVFPLIDRLGGSTYTTRDRKVA